MFRHPGHDHLEGLMDMAFSLIPSESMEASTAATFKAFDTLSAASMMYISL